MLPADITKTSLVVSNAPCSSLGGSISHFIPRLGSQLVAWNPARWNFSVKEFVSSEMEECYKSQQFHFELAFSVNAINEAKQNKTQRFEKHNTATQWVILV